MPGDALVQKPYNYRLVKDPSVVVYCGETDVAPLSDKDFLLLEAIYSPGSRYETFIAGNKLDWGRNLRPGNPVYVSIPYTKCRAAAVIRYFGGLPPDRGLMFGIEITVSYRVS